MSEIINEILKQAPENAAGLFYHGNGTCSFYEEGVHLESDSISDRINIDIDGNYRWLAHKEKEDWIIDN